MIVNLKEFCEKYMPKTLSLPWTIEQSNLIEHFQTMLDSDGIHKHKYFTKRGMGATSIVTAAALYAIKERKSKLVLVLTASSAAAESIASRIADRRIIVKSITESVRGLSIMIDGEFTRPDFVIIDSPFVASDNAARRANRERAVAVIVGSFKRCVMITSSEDREELKQAIREEIRANESFSKWADQFVPGWVEPPAEVGTLAKYFYRVEADGQIVMAGFQTYGELIAYINAKDGDELDTLAQNPFR